MILPFIAVFTKPFFCALADRHRRYRLYFILSLLATLIGFGAYTFMPFFPDFIEHHGRAAFYILTVFTIIGYIAYGVVWSLGDAYAANVSHKTGESFGLIRLWGTIGWGVAGALVGMISPYLNLPEMVLGFLIFIVTHVFEIILLCWWPNGEDFEMGDAIPTHGGDEHAIEAPRALDAKATMVEKPAAVPQATNDTLKPSDILLTMSQLSSGELSIKRTQSNSLAITTKVKLDVAHKPGDKLDRTINDLVAMAAGKTQDLEKAAEMERRRIADLQMTTFKMVAMKHKSLIKYLLIFVALGTVYNIHWSYFFLHLERLAEEGKGGDFSTLVGMCLVAQSVGETFCFAIAPWVVGKLGRDGSISLNAIAYAVRYFGNGLGIPLVSPYVAVITESLQGINYGIFYYLITDTALHFALLVDDVIPEMRAKGLIDEKSDIQAVRTSLRATMQGVFSGAFDGLGFGLGSLIAGLVLEQHSYEQLWCYAGTAALVIFVIHALYEIVNQFVRTCLRKRKESSWISDFESKVYGDKQAHNFYQSNMEQSMPPLSKINEIY